MKIVKAKTGKLNLFSKIFLSILKFIIKMYFKIFHFLKIEGIENIPREGAVIFASNHVSFYDPPLIGAIVPRFCRYLARDNFFTIPIFGKLIYIWGAIPIKREAADKSAIVQSIKLLNEQEAVIIFPEGTRSQNGNLGEMKSGVINLAMHTNATIVPITIHNGYKAWSRHRKFPRLFVPMKIKFYQPLKYEVPKDREEIKKLQNNILEELKKILSEANKI